MTWLFDTLVWTGAIVAAVLLLRRPVARHFGPRAAYALWLLPIVRLALPPLRLPGWLAPAAPIETAAPGGATVIVTQTDTVALAVPAEAATSVDWTALAGAVWLAGAVVFAALRLAAYARLRRDLLAEARAVGEHGGVRFVETPATASPVAFGVVDRIVALPPGFMAQPDRVARDLALAHELEHHRAGDLVVNFAALPLFALHWFNPLARLGWVAMRRDQEAACDARVLAMRPGCERAAYAALIAGAAAAPRAALAAPMACPVLGDKSIIHRLRTMTMPDHSLRRRRFGMVLVGAAALVLPLTATITYAQDDSPLPPAPPEVPAVPGVALPLQAEPAPSVPVPPAATREEDSRIVIDDVSPDGSKREQRVMVFRSDTGEEKPVQPSDLPVITSRRIVLKGRDGKAIAPDSPEFEAQMERLGRAMDGLGKPDEKPLRIEIERIERTARRIAEDGARTADMAARAAEAGARTAAVAARTADAGARAAAMASRVSEECDGAQSVTDRTTADGRTTVRICQSRSGVEGLVGLKLARSSIARLSGLRDGVQREILAELDREIAELESGRQ